MPKWGLTQDQINAEPWGLPPAWLRAHKQITDPVHGDIYLTALETAVLDTAPMQRLRRVRQLGTTHLVYPGATHTRLSHALGTLRAAQNLLDVVLAQGAGKDPVPDLFGEWQEKKPSEVDRMVGEATVLARLGGLLHDLGHIPFGHTLEDDLELLDPHDANEDRYEKLWGKMARDLETQGVEIPAKLEEELKPLILSKSKSEDVEATRRKSEYPFVADIVGNTICADLVDYLQRDHLYTGLPAAVGRRFLDGFYVTPSSHPYEKRRMVIRIKREGRARADVVSELFKYLRYRYELSERALNHHAKLAADVMVGKAMEMWKSALAAEMGTAGATREIERQALRRGDDGLLEYMLDEVGKHDGDSRWQGVAELTRRLQKRKLFKRIGFYTNRAMAGNLYKKYHKAEARAEAERDAVRQAGVEDDWKVALWVPKPEMRFKAADVLVDDGAQIEIVALGDWDWENGRRGSEIFESHRGLWATCLYVDAELSAPQQKAIREKLKQALGIREWDDEHPVRARAADESAPAEEKLVEEAATPSGSEQPLLDRATERAIAKLEEWRAVGKRSSIQHPGLEDLVLTAEDLVVVVDGEVFDLAKEGEVARLNLTLFFRDLPPDFFETHEGRDQLSVFIRRSSADFEGDVLDEYATSEAARRGGEAVEDADPATHAFRIAAEKFRRLL